MARKFIFKVQKLIDRLYKKGEIVLSLPLTDSEIEEYIKAGFIAVVEEKGFIELEEDVIDELKPDIESEEKKIKYKSKRKK